MSKNLQALHGVELVDALFAEWPMPERSALEWEDFADGIMAKLESEPFAPGQQSDEEVTPDAKFLLAPTLNGANTSGAEAPVSHPPVPGAMTARQSQQEESSMGASQRDRRSSLQDLARLANEGPLSQRSVGNGPDSFAAAPMSQRSSARVSEGSGIVDLASLASLPNVPPSLLSAAQLNSERELPKSDTFEVGQAPAAAYSAPASEAAPPSMQESIPPMPLSIAPAALSTSLTDSGITQPRRMSGPSVGIVFGGIVGALAVAAGALFFVVSKKAPAADTAQASTTVVAPEQKTEAPVVAPVAEVAKAEEAAGATGATGAMDPSALPTTATNTDSQAGSHHSHSSSAGTVAATATPSSSKQDAKTAKEEAKAAKEAKKVAAAEPAAPSGIPDNALGAEMKKAAGPGVVGTGDTGGKADSQFAAGTVPQRPSQGTLTSALGRVMGKAKSCIGPDDPISKASVVFASAGTVQSVAVTGNAAGKPAEACIKSALMGAKLNTPFAEPTYTTSLTIRP